MVVSVTFLKEEHKCNIGSLTTLFSQSVLETNDHETAESGVVFSGSSPVDQNSLGEPVTMSGLTEWVHLAQL